MNRVFVSAIALAFGVLDAQAQTPAPGAAQQTPPAQTRPPQPVLGRPSPPQPQQKQGLEYLVGSWSFTWTGRESPVTAGPRKGTLTFTRAADGASLEMRSEGTTDDGVSFKESGTVDWNEASKTLAFKELLSGGIQMIGTGDWSSPLAIRYTSEPTRVGNQTVRVRRTYSILSAQSFASAEELSIDGGPFQRLGNGTFGKVEAAQTSPPQARGGGAVYKEACATCHDKPTDRTPDVAALKTRTPDAIVAALSTGSMATHGEPLSPAERRAVAEFLTGQSPSAPPSSASADGSCATRPAALADPASMPRWSGWGNSTSDGRTIWDFNTACDFETVNRVPAKGGSIDAAGPAIAGGLLVTTSGYGLFRGRPRNVMRVFAVK